MPEQSRPKRQLPRMPDPARLEIAALVETYAALAESSSHFVRGSELAERLDLGIGVGLVTRALKVAADPSPYIRMDANGDVTLTDDGFYYVQTQQDNVASDIHKYLEQGRAWLLKQEKSLESPSEVDPEEIVSVATRITVPAANRYVSVHDNEPPFESLSRTLSEIRDEFARDHNKGELTALPSDSFDETAAEIDGTLAQISHGRVRIGQLVEGLDPALRKVLPYLSAYPALCKLLKDALDLIHEILSAIGTV